MNAILLRWPDGEHAMIRPWVIRNANWNFAIIIAALVIASLVIAPVSGMSNDFKTTRPTAVPTRSDTQIMTDWAHQLATDHPDMNQMSQMDKAKFIFAQYSQALRDSNSPVNSNRLTRVMETIGNLDTSRFTCDWHTKNLDTVFSALGFMGLTHEIVADQTSAQTLVTLDPNRNHEALLVIIDGKAFVFDAWKMAVDNNGQYISADDLLSQNADTNIYDGMPLDQWNKKMQNDDYVRFTVMDDPDNYVFYPSAIDAAAVIPGFSSTSPATPTFTTRATLTLTPTPTPGLGNGLRVITVTSQDLGYETKPFTVPAGSKATGFKATYDFSSAKPGFGAYFQVSIQKTAGFGGTDTTIWSTELMGDGWGSSSGTTKTEGSLDTMVLLPGSYSFTAERHLTSPSDEYSPIPATLTYSVV